MKNRKQRPEGVNGSLKFLSKYLAAVPKSNPKSKHTQDQFVHKPTGGWIPPVMTKKYSGTNENQRKWARGEEWKQPTLDGGRTVCGSDPDCLQSNPVLSAVQISKNDREETVLDSAETGSADCLGQQGQTVRGLKNAQMPNWNEQRQIER